MQDEPLSGGNLTPVTRRGDEVLREAGTWTTNVHALLTTLTEAGVQRVPRVLGLTDDGRERLSFLPGTVAHYPLPHWIWRTEILEDAARLLRQIHDATVGLIDRHEGWRQLAREPVEVICHNDFAPYNFVFDHGRLVGVIDFDMAAPGPRIRDLAYLAYRLVPYGEDAGEPADIGRQRSRRTAALLEAYGCTASDDELHAAMADGLIELAEFSEERARSTGRRELAEHAAMYRRDAARLVQPG